MLNRLVADLTQRGPTAWLLSALLTGFYVLLYFSDALEGPARALGLDGKWRLYGALYTVVMVGFGARYLRVMRHNRYQVVRTITVVGVQVSLAFSIPALQHALEMPEYYFSYLWPLKIESFYPDVMASQPAGLWIYSLVAALVVSPLLTLKFGKRWYCSWVCGCGGLANTLGDGWRHLSTKSSRSWAVEQVTVHAMLALSVVTTVLVVLSAWLPAGSPWVDAAVTLRRGYGLWVGAVLSGVVGVGLYPVAGTRVWCRFFCPMAAMLGLIQKLGRFHIRVKKDMCISCGLCSHVCEMGIDVRAYAQRSESFTRASCVGCGLCAEVCPRGVLRLENARTGSPRLPVLV